MYGNLWFLQGLCGARSVLRDRLFTIEFSDFNVWNLLHVMQNSLNS